jgi:hypothetical protein
MTNRSYLVRLSQNFGDYNLFLRNMASKDSALGFGQQYDMNLTWVKGNFAASGGWTHADGNFRPRLGFVQEVDVQGPFLAVEFNKNFNKGPIKDAHVEGVVLSYDHVDSTFYRKEAGAAANTTLASGLNVAVGADVQDFEGSKDSLYSIRLTYPRGNRYKFVQIGADSGRQAGSSYKNYLISSAYRIAKGFQLTLRAQHVDYLGSSDQLIASANYDLGRDRSISGRVVRQGSNTNAYVAFQRSGNEGIEYFLLLGDPNAEKFRASLILKVVVPFTIGRRSSAGANRTVLSSLDTAPHG